MAGIGFLENKDQATINYIVNELLKPENKSVLFDDYLGFSEIAYLMYDKSTAIYAFYEKGKPEPIGVVFFTGVIPYRNTVLYACVFDKKNRNKGIIQDWAEKIQFDLVKRFAVHSVSSNVIDKNEVSAHLLEKLGFEKIGTKKSLLMTKGKYRDLIEYYLLLEK